MICCFNKGSGLFAVIMFVAKIDLLVPICQNVLYGLLHCSVQVGFWRSSVVLICFKFQCTSAKEGIYKVHAVDYLQPHSVSLHTAHGDALKGK